MKFIVGLIFSIFISEVVMAQAEGFTPRMREGYASFEETSKPVDLAQQMAEQSAVDWCVEVIGVRSAFRVGNWLYKAKLDENFQAIGYYAGANFSCEEPRPNPTPVEPPKTEPQPKSCKSRPYGPYCYWDGYFCHCEF